MSIPLGAPEALDQEHLVIRARLLEIASALDRIGRAAGDVAGDRRVHKIRQAIDVLTSSTNDRAEQIQLIFSREYDHDWQQQFGVSSG